MRKYLVTDLIELDQLMFAISSKYYVGECEFIKMDVRYLKADINASPERMFRTDNERHIGYN